MWLNNIFFYTFVFFFFLDTAQSERYNLEPLKAMLDQKCSSILIVDSQPFGNQEFLQHLLGKVTNAGFTVVDKISINLNRNYADKLRGTCLCCQIVYFKLSSPKKNPRPLLDKIKMGNSRIILVVPSESRFKRFNYDMQDAVLVLSEQSLSLICPKDQREANTPMQKLLDVYSQPRKKWRGHFDMKSRKLYRHCNPGKNFYHSRHMAATGSFERISIFNGAKRLGLQIAEALGAESIDLTGNTDAGLVSDIDSLRNDTILGQVHNGLVDFTTGVVMNEVSSTFAEALRFGEGEFLYVTHKPRQLPKYQNISFPFDITVWSLLFVSTAAMMLGMCLAYRTAMGRRGRTFKMEYYFDVCFMTFGVAVMEMHGKLLVDNRLTKTGFKLRALWVVVATLLSMAYQGNLKASLTRKVYEKNPETTWEMLEQDLPVYLVDVGYSKDFYLTHPNPIYKAIYERANKEDTFIPRKDFPAVLMQVFNGDLAFVQSSGGLDNIQRTLFAEKYGDREYPLVRIKERYDFYPIAFLVPRYLQQAEEIAKVIRGLMENGIIEHDEKTDRVKSMQGESGGEKLVVEHIVVCLGILAASFTLALMTFIIEFVTDRNNKLKNIFN